jgi:hypothetical protein
LIHGNTNELFLFLQCIPMGTSIIRREYSVNCHNKAG